MADVEPLVTWMFVLPLGMRATEEVEMKGVRGLMVGVTALVAIASPIAARGGSAASATYSKASIAGTWTWSLDGSLGVRYRFAQIGIATFDGKGGCTIALKENSGVNGAYDHNSDECTYDVSKTGMGTMEYSLDGEAGAASIAVGKGEIRVAIPDEATVGGGILKRHRAMDLGDLKGSWSFSYGGSIFGERIAGAGVMSFDGAGKCSQAITYNYGTGEQVTESESCIYEIGEDGFGSVTMSYDNGTGGDFFFIPRANGNELVMLTTPRGEILIGDAQRR